MYKNSYNLLYMSRVHIPKYMGTQTNKEGISTQYGQADNKWQSFPESVFY